MLPDTASCFGVVIINGKGLLIAEIKKLDDEILQTNILYDESVKLPNSHDNGGQSQNRFQRIYA